MARKATATTDSAGESTTPALPEINVTNSSSKVTVLVANQHTGAIMFPRKGESGVSLSPLILGPGVVTEIDADEWNLRKKNVVVQAYMDRRLIVEVDRRGAVPVLSQTSSELEIPEHLQTEEEQGAYATASVRSDRTKIGEVSI